MIDHATPEGGNRPAGSPSNPERRLVGYPSPQFPGPPQVLMQLPPDWIPIDPAGYLGAGPKIDVAVAGPTATDGIRPSLVVSVSRTLPSDDPETLVRAIAGAPDHPERANGGKVFAGTHVAHLVGFEETVDETALRRLQCVTYVDRRPIAHVVTALATVAASDEDGLRVVAEVIKSLGVAQPPVEPGEVA
ncbi:MAG: hypothetical protein AAF467_17685 [Actinomycetota bacterium]